MGGDRYVARRWIDSAAGFFRCLLRVMYTLHVCRLHKTQATLALGHVFSSKKYPENRPDGVLDVWREISTGRRCMRGMNLIVAVKGVAGSGIFCSGDDQGAMVGVNISGLSGMEVSSNILANNADKFWRDGHGFRLHQCHRYHSYQAGRCPIYWLPRHIYRYGLRWATSDRIGRIGMVVVGRLPAVFGAALLVFMVPSFKLW